MGKKTDHSNKQKVNKKNDLSKYIPSDYDTPLGIEFSKKEINGNKSNQDSYDEVHGVLYKMTHNNTIPWRNYIIYAILLTLLTCAFTFSKYTSQLTSQDAATVAGFGYTITGDFKNKNDVVVSDANASDEIDCSFDSDDAKDYKFTIKNTGDVTVTVTVTPTNYGNFVIKLDDTTISSSTTSKSYEIKSGGTSTVTMNIDPSAASDGATSKMLLKINVDQKD